MNVKKINTPEILALFVDDAPFPDPTLSKPFVIDCKLCASSRCAFVAIDVSEASQEYSLVDGKKLTYIEVCSV